MSSEPDATWSEWSEPRRGSEIALTSLPPARYVQWRADLAAGDRGSPLLSEVAVSYRQQNLAPRVKRLAVLDPGQILVPTNFNPGAQVFEPAHPNRQGIFTVLEASPGREERPVKALWKRGFRTLRWEVEDPNADDLVYSLSFRRADSDGPWLEVADEIDVEHHSFDVSGLPDGLYRFRLVASDRPDNAPDEVREAEEVSETVVIDHTPPSVIGVTREDGKLVVQVEDALNPLRTAEVSVDAGGWEPAATRDGLLDGYRETLEIAPPSTDSLSILRVSDAAFNAVTIDLGSVGR